jgi:hypothetical protein
VSAAIQLAIWDVEYNNPYSVQKTGRNGKYYVSVNSQNLFTYTGIPSGTVNLANTYLANVEAGGIWSTPDYSVTLLTQGGNQSMVYVGTTPLPGAFPLFATGLVVLGLLARQRKRKAALET